MILASNRRRRGLLLAALAATVSAGLATPGPASAQSKLRFLTGPFRDSQALTEREWAPLAAYIASRLGNDVELVIAPDWPSVGRMLADGKADIAWMGGAFRFVQAIAPGAGEPIATVKFNGSASYHAIVIGKPSLEVADWPRSAAGLSISFTHDASTTGWLVPYAALVASGIDPRTFFRYTEGAQHAENVQKVARGEVDLATDNDNNWNAMLARGAVPRDATKVFWRSGPIPQDPIVVRPGLPAATVERLRAAFVSITDEVGASIPLPRGYTGFVAATPDTYRAIREAAVLTERATR